MIRVRRALASPFLCVVMAAFCALCATGFNVARAADAKGATSDASGAQRAIPVRVELDDKQDGLRRLQEMRIDVDGVFDGWTRVFVTPEEYDKLEGMGFRLTPLPDEGKIGLARMAEEGVAINVGRAVPALYHTYETLTSDLQTIVTDHPGIARLSSIGQSVQGRELWVMRISDNPDLEEDEPEIAYISSMHGDEVTGKELTFNLINYLTDNYGTDPRVTALVDGAEIWIMPSMNPDGTELGQRYNADGIDLNRDFPDEFVDPVNTGDGRAVETGLMINWSAGRNIILSANFHGGALLMNYPRDGNPEGASVFSPAPDPDQAALYSISRSYADTNPPMYANDGDYLHNGVTNGAEWYAITGGMQDWRYVWPGGFEVTIEVSSTKWPAASQLPQFWAENQESMLAYFERGLEGVRGVVTDGATDLPVAAEVRIDSNPYPSYTDPDVGDYHRVVLPGSYSLEVSALGYASQTVPVTIVAGSAVRYDVVLQPLDTLLETVSNRVEDGVGGDGVLDPSEAADLAVTLRNLGRAATTVNAMLESTGWYASVTREQAAYADIATGGSVESEAPHFAVLPAATIPAGHRIGFALRWQTDSASGVTEPFFLDFGEPSCGEDAALDVPLAVTEALPTTTSLIALTSDKVISDVQVPIDLSHTYIGDLDIVLTSPQGTSVVLHSRGGGSTDDIVGTYGVDLSPSEPLSAFDGELAAGTWVLKVTDNAGGDTGTLNGWSVILCGRPPEAVVPEMKFSGLTAEAGGTRVEWWPYPGVTSYNVYRSTDSSSGATFMDVTGEDGDVTDTTFFDASVDPLVFYLVTGVGSQGEGVKGHYGE